MYAYACWVFVLSCVSVMVMVPSVLVGWMMVGFCVGVYSCSFFPLSVCSVSVRIVLGGILSVWRMSWFSWSVRRSSVGGCGSGGVHDAIVEFPYVLDWLWTAQLDEDETHNTNNEYCEDECVYGLECESVTHMLFFLGGLFLNAGWCW